MILSSAVDQYFRLERYAKILKVLAQIFIVVAIIAVCVLGAYLLVNLIRSRQKRKQEDPEEKNTKIPLFRITKQKELKFWQKLIIRVGIFLVGFALYMMIINLITGASNAQILSTLFKGNFGSSINIWALLRNTFLLFGVGVALIPVFKMRFWNIGAEGQILVGGLATFAIMKYLTPAFHNMQFLLFIIMFLGGILAGMLWGIFPALFKAKFGTNETLFTLMMNYIAIQLVRYFCIKWEKVPGSGDVGIINNVFGSEYPKVGWIPNNFLSSIFGSGNYVLLLLLVGVVALAMYVYMKYTKQGYEIKVVGGSVNTANYAAIDVEKVTIRTVLISSAICGFVGMLIVAGVDHSLSPNLAAGRGFTAITVTWLGNFNMGFMLIISALLTFFSAGAKRLASDISLNASMSDVLIGILIFFILISEFFIRYKVIINRKKKDKEELANASN